MIKIVSDLISIAAAGASLEVDGSRYSGLELVSVAAALKDNAYLKVHNGNSKSLSDCISIAAAKRGQVIFA